MSSKKKNIIIVIVLVIVVAGLLYWGGGLFVIEQKEPYWSKYKDMFELDFSQVSDMNEEDKQTRLEELDVYIDLIKKGEKGDVVKSFIGLAFLKKVTLDYEASEEALILAGKADPKNTASFGNLGNLYLYFIKDYPKAEEAYQKAIDNYSFKIDYYRDLSILYEHKLDDVEKAEETTLRALKNNPSDIDAYKLIVSFYIKQKNKEKAVWYNDELRGIDLDTASLFDEQINEL